MMQFMNGYTAMNNNPISFIDPDGGIVFTSYTSPEKDTPPLIVGGAGNTGNTLYQWLAMSHYDRNNFQNYYGTAISATGLGLDQGSMASGVSVQEGPDGTTYVVSNNGDYLFSSNQNKNPVANGMKGSWVYGLSEPYIIDGSGGSDGFHVQSDEIWNFKAQSGGGNDFSLAGMYAHFQFGGGNPMTINASSLDFSGTNQKQLGLDKIGIGKTLDPVNLFKAGINSNSLAFGRLSMTRVSETQFSIAPNMFDFDYQSDASWQRNAGTILGSMINYNLFPGAPFSPLVPLIFGGPYNVIFNGTVTIPK
jgi:hypothetical protein